MKNNAGLIILCAGLCLLFASPVYNHFKTARAENQRHQDQAAICNFYLQLNAVNKEFYPKFDAEMGQSLFSSDQALYRSFYLRLNSINVSSCPIDFQQAWSECLKNEQGIADEYAAGRGWVNATVNVLKLKSLNPSFWKHMSELKNARLSAYTELKASAIRHGLEFNK